MEAREAPARPVQAASKCNFMQKVLTEMNLHIHHVFRETLILIPPNKSAWEMEPKLRARG